MAKILIVDDRPINRQFLLTLLPYGGHQVVEAADGLQALEQARLERPDLVIADILMPTMDGVAFAKHLRAEAALAATPVIFYTATYRVQEAHKLADSCGVTHVLPKPSEPELILKTVNEALGIRPPPVVAEPTLPSPPAGFLSARADTEALSAISDRLGDHLASLQKLNHHTATLIERSAVLAEDRDRLAEMSHRLSDSLSCLQTLSLRVATLLELGLDLALERDAHRLLEVFCRGAHNIMSARFAGVGVLKPDGQSLRWFLTKGLNVEEQARLGQPNPRAGLLGNLLDEDPAARRCVLEGDPRTVGLPESHPPFRSFLCARIATANRVYGWVYFADRLGADEFSEEDERIALTLAGQAATSYEGIQLLDDLKHQTDELQCEVARRQGAEEELRWTHEKLRQLLAHSPAVIYTLRLDGPQITPVVVSDNIERLLGVSVAEAASYDWWVASLHPDDRDRVLADTRRLLAQGGFSMEYRVRHRDGTYRWIDDTTRVIRDASGQPKEAVGVWTDITGRKWAEEALAAESTRWKTLMEMSTDCIHLLDLEGDLLEANESFFRALGYTPEEGKCLNVADWDAQWTREQLKERLRSMLDKSAVFETRHRRKDGTVFEVEAGVTGARIAGEPMFFCITRDISARKKSEQALRESEERYRKLVELSPDAIYVHRDGRFVLLNKVACALFGVSSPASLIGTPIVERVHPDFHAVVRERIRQILEEQTSVPALEEKLIRLDGTPFDAEVSAAPFMYEGRPSALVMVRDITEKKALNEKTLRNQRLESLGTLAGGIAHDLNNVLAPILMSLELLELKLTDEPSQKILSTLASSAKRGSELVKQVLSFSRGMKGERVAVQLRHVVREMQGIIRETFPKLITLQIQMPGDLWTVNGDATQLHQVLMNLCVNARDAIPRGGSIVISGENVVLDEAFARMNTAARPGPHVVLSVTDTGTGMPPEVQRRIFEPFFTTKEQGKGTGLGLSTVHTIVKNHGGFLNVYSEVGRGTRFKVYLPAAPSEESREAELQRAIRRHGRGELVLIAEDEPAIQQIAQETLEAWGYRALAADNGADAVALCAQNIADVKVLLTDMMMPVMDGPATIRAVRRIVPKVKVIATSGLGSEVNEIDLLKMGADDFIRKPFTADELLRIVGEALGA